MPPPRKSLPSYLPHNQSGRARAVWTDRTGTRQFRMLPGAFDSEESRTAFARLQLELETAPRGTEVGRQPDHSSDRSGLSVSEVLLAFLDHAEAYYRTPDGRPTSEVAEVKASLKSVRELYGHTPAVEFGPRALAAVRQHMIGLNWCRSLINRRIDRVKRTFKWAAAEELVPATVFQALQTLSGLRKARTEARESEAVKPVDPAVVEATLPFLTTHLRAMVRLQWLTGMRPGEVCAFRFSEVERSGKVWVYRPARHKTAHHGKGRAVHLGPRARAAIVEFLVGDVPPPDGFAGVDLADDTARLVAADAYQEAGRERDAELLRDLTRRVVSVGGCVVDPNEPLFSPYHAREARFRLARQNRKSKVPPSQQNRRKASPERAPRGQYTTQTYAHAVGRASAKAGVEHWHPNQLRHLFATEVRKEFGLEATQVLLGHSRADVTQIYAEKNEALAASVVAKIG